MDKAATEKRIEHKVNGKHESGMTLDETKSALESSQEQLSAAQLHYEKLKPSCIDTGMSYEDFLFSFQFHGCFRYII